MTTVRLENLRKEFDAGDIVAVDDVSLTVEDGEFLAVVGPSGCGESTTLRLIAGLEGATDGRVHIGGADVTDLSARKRDVAMVFQNYALYPHKTVFENMEFGLRMSTDLDAVERREKVERAAEMMGDRMAILKHGVLYQAGPPKEVYRHPDNEFVGGFVGSPSMNFIDVTTERTDEGVALADSNGPFESRLTGPLGGALTSDGDYTIGLRPEDVFIDSGEFEATAEVVEPVGSDNYVHLDVAEGFLARVTADVEPAVGEVVPVRFDESALRVFDAEGRAVEAAERAVV